MDGFEPHPHRQVQLDAVAPVPWGMNGGKSSSRRRLRAPPVYRNRGPLRPHGNPEIDRELSRLRGLYIEAHAARERIFAVLAKFHLRPVFGPSKGRGDVQVYVYSPRVAEVAVDGIVRAH